MRAWPDYGRSRLGQCAGQLAAPCAQPAWHHTACRHRCAAGSGRCRGSSSGPGSGAHGRNVRRPLVVPPSARTPCPADLRLVRAAAARPARQTRGPFDSRGSGACFGSAPRTAPPRVCQHVRRPANAGKDRNRGRCPHPARQECGHRQERLCLRRSIDQGRNAGADHLARPGLRGCRSGPRHLGGRCGA